MKGNTELKTKDRNGIFHCIIFAAKRAIVGSCTCAYSTFTWPIVYHLPIFSLQTWVGTATQTALKGNKSLQFEGFANLYANLQVKKRLCSHSACFRLVCVRRWTLSWLWTVEGTSLFRERPAVERVGMYFSLEVMKVRHFDATAFSWKGKSNPSRSLRSDRRLSDVEDVCLR